MKTVKGLFDAINRRISNNLRRHGHTLTVPHAADRKKAAKTVDVLIEFVRPERRRVMQALILKILRQKAVR